MARNTPPDNPYLAARQEWTERYGSYVRAASSWRIVGITGMLLAVISTTYALYQSTQVKLVPYIVEVDKLGSAVSAGFPQQIEYADPRVVRATLGDFLSNFRSVTPDAVVQKGYIDRTYALLRTSDPATEKVNNWFRSNSPFEKARAATVAVEVNNIVPLSNQSYQIDWAEYERRSAASARSRPWCSPLRRTRRSSASIQSASTSAISTGPRSSRNRPP
jgi:type IV secretion system protein VirB5